MNEMTPSFEQWRSLRLARIERALDVALPPANTRLHQVMRYAVLGNGKRIRPLLCVAAGDWAGAPDHTRAAAAAALEVMQANWRHCNARRWCASWQPPAVRQVWRAVRQWISKAPARIQRMQRLKRWRA